MPHIFIKTHFFNRFFGIYQQQSACLLSSLPRKKEDFSHFIQCVERAKQLKMNPITHPTKILTHKSREAWCRVSMASEWSVYGIVWCLCEKEPRKKRHKNWILAWLFANIDWLDRHTFTHRQPIQAKGKTSTQLMSTEKDDEDE